MRFFTFIILTIALALRYASAQLNNLALGDGVVYASAGSDGIIVLDVTTGAEKTTIPPPAGFGGVHDLAVDGDLLFVLDASQGSVGVFNIASAEDPTFITDSVQDVDVGPFAGVSAGGGVMVVSGGTGNMSVFRYTDAGALTRLTDSIDLGVGQPDVLVDNEGSYAYVSTDFSGSVDGAGFGITTVDLTSSDISSPSIERIGLTGAGFTGGVQSPANFPVESAISGSRLLVAHGGGLSILSLANPARPSLTTTLSLDFPAVNVDADGNTAVVVGGTSKPAAAYVNLENNEVKKLALPETSGATTATGVSLLGETVFIAAGELIVCDNCIKSAPSSGSQSGSGEPEIGSGSNDPSETDNGDSDGNDSDICVEEAYLLSRGVARSELLHKGSVANVLCPGNGLPCGTPSHVVRFAGSYVTYKELCTNTVSTCRPDRKVVNGVSIRHARLLCGANDENCVVPHVMRTGFEMERALIRAIHSRIVAN